MIQTERTGMDGRFAVALCVAMCFGIAFVTGLWYFGDCVTGREVAQTTVSDGRTLTATHPACPEEGQLYVRLGIVVFGVMTMMVAAFAVFMFSNAFENGITLWGHQRIPSPPAHIVDAQSRPGPSWAELERMQAQIKLMEQQSALITAKIAAMEPEQKPDFRSAFGQAPLPSSAGANGNGHGGTG